MQLTAKDLTKTYGSRTVVDSLSLQIHDGQILGLLGPNGAGKSTVIKMLSGQIKPTSGQIIIDGQHYSNVPNNLRGSIGVMPQEVVIWDDLTTKENLQFTTSLQQMDKKSADESISFIIEALNFQSELNTLAKNLSGGFKRRLNLAISIIHNPSLIFLDEPTPGIDPQNRRFLWEFIETLKSKPGNALVLTDHYLEEAEKLSDYVLIMDEGKEIAKGTVQELKAKYTDGSVLRFKIEHSGQDTKPLDRLFSEIKKSHPEAKRNNNQLMIVGHNISSEISSVLDLIKDNKLTARDINVSEPSLEDVFLILTGKEVRD